MWILRNCYCLAGSYLILHFFPQHTTKTRRKKSKKKGKREQTATVIFLTFFFCRCFELVSTTSSNRTVFFTSLLYTSVWWMLCVYVDVCRKFSSSSHNPLYMIIQNEKKKVMAPWHKMAGSRQLSLGRFRPCHPSIMITIACHKDKDMTSNVVL